MIKATAGGGGRGMRLAMKESEFYSLLKQASQEAEGAFGNGAVYLERYVQNPRHIEFQARILERRFRGRAWKLTPSKGQGQAPNQPKHGLIE